MGHRVSECFKQHANYISIEIWLPHVGGSKVSDLRPSDSPRIASGEGGDVFERARAGS